MIYDKTDDMKTLVTGGAGFIGSHLVDRLIKENHKVVVIDNLSTGKKVNLNKKAKFYKIDICSPCISEIFKKEKPQVVFHYAAQIDVRKSVENPIEDAKINILGSLNIIQNFIRINPPNQPKSVFKKIIFASSGAIYGDTDIIPTSENHFPRPLTPYGITKLSIEKYLDYYYKIFGLPFTSLRLANVYGPRQNSKGEAEVVAIFIDKMLSDKQPIINGSGQQTRDFVYVSDVIEANILAMKENKVGVFNIGTAKETNINTIFRKLKKMTNSKCRKVHGLAKFAEQKRSCLDFQKAKKELGWKPKYSLEKGLETTVNWFQQNL